MEDISMRGAVVRISQDSMEAYLTAAAGDRRGIHIIRAGAVYPHPAGNQWN